MFTDLAKGKKYLEEIKALAKTVLNNYDDILKTQDKIISQQNAVINGSFTDKEKIAELKESLPKKKKELNKNLTKLKEKTKEVGNLINKFTKLNIDFSLFDDDLK